MQPIGKIYSGKITVSYSHDDFYEIKSWLRSIGFFDQEVKLICGTKCFNHIKEMMKDFEIDYTKPSDFFEFKMNGINYLMHKTTSLKPWNFVVTPIIKVNFK